MLRHWCSKDYPPVRRVFKTLKSTCVRQTIMGPATMRTARLKTTRRLTHISSILGRTGPFHNGWLRKAKIRKLGPRPYYVSAARGERDDRASEFSRDAQLSWEVQRLAATISRPCWIFPVWLLLTMVSRARNRVSSFAKDQGRPIKSHIVLVPASVSLFIVRLTTSLNPMKLLRSMSSQPCVDLSLNK